MSIRQGWCVVAAGAVLVLSACDGGDDGSAAPTDSAATTTEVEMRAPVIVAVTDLAKGDVRITTDRPLVVKVPDAPERWTVGDVDDETVAGFIPGHEDGSGTFNPGFTARGVGGTTARITDPGTGEVITFTLIVTG